MKKKRSAAVVAGFLFWFCPHPGFKHTCLEKHITEGFENAAFHTSGEITFSLSEVKLPLQMDCHLGQDFLHSHLPDRKCFQEAEKNWLYFLMLSLSPVLGCFLIITSQPFLSRKGKSTHLPFSLLKCSYSLTATVGHHLSWDDWEADKN